MGTEDSGFGVDDTAHIEWPESTRSAPDFAFDISDVLQNDVYGALRPVRRLLGMLLTRC